MENNALYDYQPLSLVGYYIAELFGEENINESKLAFLADVGLRLIGNRHQNIYKYNIPYSDFYKEGNNICIPVPCNIESVEAVLDGNIDEFTYYNDYKYSYSFPSYSKNYGYHNIDCFLYKEQREYFGSGNLINYKFTGDKIIILNDIKSDINVIYRGSLLDSDGKPLVTSREAIGLAYYWFWMNEQKKIATSIGGDGNRLAYAQQQMKLHIARARVPEKFSQNDLNNMKDSLKSKGFSPYGKPLKFGR